MEPLRRAALCLTDQPLLATGYRPSREPHGIAFVPRGETVLLRIGSGLGAIHLSIRIRYRLVPPLPATGHGWRIETNGYLYAIIDREDCEILAYHWRPFARGPAFPHLHLSSRIGELPVGEDASPVALGEMHLPTEELSFPTIVRLLLGEFAVAARRDDWEPVVAESEAARRAGRAGAA